MEKTGNTVKLVYDFNTAGVCEVCIKSNWYRTTAREFRSFDGQRRITEPIKQPGIRDEFVNIKFHTYQYDGPIYVLQTNTQVVGRLSETVITNSDLIVTQKSITNSNRI